MRPANVLYACFAMATTVTVAIWSLTHPDDAVTEPDALVAAPGESAAGAPAADARPAGPATRSVDRRRLGPGLDLVVRRDGADIEYELIVEPGSEPNVRLTVRGTDPGASPPRGSRP
jgi:hypothetical protein